MTALFQNCGKDNLAEGVLSLASSGENSKACKVTPKSKVTLERTNLYRKFTSSGRKLLSVRSQFESGSKLTFKRRESPECHGPLYTAAFLDSDTSAEELEFSLQQDSCIEAVSETVFYEFVSIPNDPRFVSQKHLETIGASAGWDVFFGSQGINKDVIIGIIDSGVDRHTDLSLWTNSGETPGNRRDDDGNGFVDDINGWNFGENNNDSYYTGISHGTHVAGLAGATSNNATGVAGVMGRNIKILSANIASPEGDIEDADVAASVRYAVDNGAKVLNLSLGGPGQSPAVKAEFERAIAMGVTIVVAAGNNGFQLSNSPTSNRYFFPAMLSMEFPGQMLTVASIESVTQRLSTFSNFHSQYVGIAAPGSESTSGLLSTVPTNAYGRMRGTSMASPVVAGAAALVVALAQSRGYDPSPSEVVDLIQSSGKTSSYLQGKVLNSKQLDLANLGTMTDAKFPVTTATSPSVVPCP